MRNSVQAFIEKMELQKLPQAAIDTFVHYYQQLWTGKTGLIFEEEIEPLNPGEIERLKNLESYSRYGTDFLKKTVQIKLNGGLGTTMGLEGPKSLIPVKNGLTFLDIIALQTRMLNRKVGFRVPIILMNSFKTEAESLQALTKYPDLATDLPNSFTQHMFPKIMASSSKPVYYPKNPQLEWNPPGHGDIYTALVTSNVLDTLLDAGYKYAFVSNIDNLGASLNTEILGYFGVHEFSFLMEVTDRTWMDRKGGHLARMKNGRLILREAAQCPPENINQFRDISRHSYFNTNNLWINLPALKELLKKKNNVLELPMIRNQKKVDPVDNDSPDAIQLESAMGTAISVFDNATVLRVPRSRFAPVKNCEELLLLWSDYYILTDQYHILQNPARKSQQVGINLDQNYYSWLSQLEERFPCGAPSLLECDSVTIIGDVKFGKNVKISGSVTISNNSTDQVLIPDHTTIDHDISF